MHERNAYRLIAVSTAALLALTGYAAFCDGLPGWAVAAIVAFGALCLRFTWQGMGRGHEPESETR